MSLYDRVAKLEIAVDGYEAERRELAVSSGFVRVTTTVVVHGGGATGRGEDVTYEAPLHDGFPLDLPFAGSWTLGALGAELDGCSLPDYRRWAFESAILDLALRQAVLSLGEALGRGSRPVRFVVSTRGDPFAWLAVLPELEFKLDAERDWDAPLMERLASTGRVRTVDLKAYYRGTTVDLAPDPGFYRAVVQAFPEAVIEDPWLEDGCLEALAGAEDRLSFDAPVHSLADLDALAVEPRWLNVKPSRFGSLARLFECVEACEERGIRMYGGGQFELGVGRVQIQELAGLFYPDAPNDVAPGVYNEGGPRPGLPRGPLPARGGIGFGA